MVADKPAGPLKPAPIDTSAPAGKALPTAQEATTTTAAPSAAKRRYMLTEFLSDGAGRQNAGTKRRDPWLQPGSRHAAWWSVRDATYSDSWRRWLRPVALS